MAKNLLKILVENKINIFLKEYILIYQIDILLINYICSLC